MDARQRYGTVAISIIGSMILMHYAPVVLENMLRFIYQVNTHISYQVFSVWGYVLGITYFLIGYLVIDYIYDRYKNRWWIGWAIQKTCFYLIICMIIYFFIFNPEHPFGWIGATIVLGIVFTAKCQDIEYITPKQYDALQLVLNSYYNGTSKYILDYLAEHLSKKNLEYDYKHWKVIKQTDEVYLIYYEYLGVKGDKICNNVCCFEANLFTRNVIPIVE